MKLKQDKGQKTVKFPAFLSSPVTDRKAYIILFVLFLVLSLPVFIKPLGYLPGFGFYFEGLGEYFATYYHPMRTQTFFSEIDSIGYYAFLPSVLIDHDLDFSNQFKLFNYSPPLTSKGVPAMTWSVGPAVLWSPFFLLGHFFSHQLNLFSIKVPLDGYSLFYELPCYFGTILYGFLASFFTFALLRRFFGGTASLFATIFTFFATPIIFYVEFEPSMSHTLAYFTAIACIYFYFKECDRDLLWNWAFIGLFGGLTALIRWQCLTLIFFILLMDLMFLLFRKAGWKALFARSLGWTVCSLSAFAAFLPQVIVWALTIGSISEIPAVPQVGVGGGNPYLSPKLLETLFSSCHGIFTWTPILVPALVGFVLLSKRKFSPGIMALWLFFISQVYFVSVSDWTSGWSFGQRRIIETLMIAALGLGELLERVIDRKRLYYFFVIIGLIFVFWNSAFIYQWMFGYVPKCDKLSFAGLTYEKITILPAMIQKALVPVFGLFNMW